MRPDSGTVLFTLGIIIAISGAAKPPAPGETFPDTIPVFIAGILAAIAGVEIWWANRSILRLLAADGSKDAPDNPIVILSQLVPVLEQLNASLGEMGVAEIESRVDEISSRYITPFVEGRQLLIDRLGLKVGASILLTAATGERLLNRSWSAAADGHLVEARNSFQQATQVFNEVAAMTAAADSAT